MLKAVLHRQALCATLAAAALACGALGVLAAAAVARWAASMAPAEPADGDLSPRILTSVGDSPASQGGSRYAGGIMADAVNG
jgi:hypothetical protein